MIKTFLTVLLLSLTFSSAEEAEQTDWLRDARLGAFMHFLPSNSEEFGLIENFDVDVLATQLKQMGASYLIFTLGQNSGFYNAPNDTYDRITGYKSGERTSKRDLPLELYEALEQRGIHLMLYLPCQAPNEDPLAQKAFGLPPGKKDQLIDKKFAMEWARVIEEWSRSYGSKVKGWWFDGGYDYCNFNDEIAAIYKSAVRAGNDDALVTFNPGLGLKRWTTAETYTAGEVGDPFKFLPESRWVEGSQWHLLTYLGEYWNRRDTRFETEQWIDWAQNVVANDGVVSLDLGPSIDLKVGPIGSFSDAQVEQFRQISEAISK